MKHNQLIHHNSQNVQDIVHKVEELLKKEDAPREQLEAILNDLRELL